jgi:N-acetylglutamate synthase
MARVESITELEHMAARHWRGTEEDRLGGWLLRAAGGFTGRANSALPLGDPDMPLDDALAAVTRWYRARALPPMIVIRFRWRVTRPAISLTIICPNGPG